MQPNKKFKKTVSFKLEPKEQEGLTAMLTYLQEKKVEEIQKAQYKTKRSKTFYIPRNFVPTLKPKKSQIIPTSFLLNQERKFCGEIKDIQRSRKKSFDAEDKNKFDTESDSSDVVSSDDDEIKYNKNFKNNKMFTPKKKKNNENKQSSEEINSDNDNNDNSDDKEKENDYEKQIENKEENINDNKNKDNGNYFKINNNDYNNMNSLRQKMIRIKTKSMHRKRKGPKDDEGIKRTSNFYLGDENNENQKELTPVYTKRVNILSLDQAKSTQFFVFDNKDITGEKDDEDKIENGDNNKTCPKKKLSILGMLERSKSKKEEEDFS